MAYSTIEDPSAHFQCATYTGTNAANNVITNDGNSDLQPDLIWASFRTSPPYTNHRCVIDSTRGRRGILESDTTAAEVQSQVGSGTNDLQSINTDGFTVGLVNSTSSLNAGNTATVAWQWKANGGTTSSNGDGSITSTVQADTTAGFSIITYTGNSNNPSSIGHGLGVVPKFYMIKQRNSANAWKVWHGNLAATDPEDYVIELNGSGAAENNAIWNDTGPTSSVINFTDHGAVNQSGDTYVAYCWVEVQGYSKFNKYVGNGNADGPFVWTGFKPAWLLIRNVGARNWLIYDNKRGAVNLNDEYIYPNNNSAEGTSSTAGYDFLSNGFKVRNTYNDGNISGESYIYVAFAENPFVANGIPTTAR